MPLSTPVSAWLLNEAATAIVREVTALCDRAAIEVLPVKGIVTSRLLYADVSERPLTDVDVRIRPRDFRRFERAAKVAGYECTRVARSYRNLTYDFGTMGLDVEAGVGPPGLCALQVDAMIERSQRREIAPGVRVLIPEIHDHALLLTVNAFKDKIVTATPWALTDLERIVLLPEFRESAFIERVHESQISTLAWIVAWWMESHRRSGVWGAIRRGIEAQYPVRRAYARLVQRQLRRAEQAPLSLRVLARVAADSRRMQIEALLHAGALVAELWLRERRRGC